MARLVLAAIAVCALLAPASAAGAPAAGLIAAYVAQRDAAIVEARDRILLAGPGGEDAVAAAGDLRARLDSLTGALRVSTRAAAPEVRAAVAARIAADGEVVEAVGAYADGRIGADRLDRRMLELTGPATPAGGAAGAPLGALDIAQAIGGPALLVGVVAAGSWQASRRRRAAVAARTRTR